MSCHKLHIMLLPLSVSLSHTAWTHTMLYPFLNWNRLRVINVLLISDRASDYFELWCSPNLHALPKCSQILFLCMSCVCGPQPAIYKRSPYFTQTVYIVSRCHYIILFYITVFYIILYCTLNDIFNNSSYISPNQINQLTEYINVFYFGLPQHNRHFSKC